MTKIFLHHYPQSPFAEKVRAILGYKGIEWWSVDVPIVPPRPSLDDLFGGFRRIPALQIGADIFTDTRLIAEVLDQIAPSPPLHTDRSIAIDAMMSTWVEPRVFVMAGPVRMATPPADGGLSDPASREKFARDRIPFMAPLVDATKFPFLRPTAEHHITHFLETIQTLLGRQKFIGGDAPTLADFSGYNPVWWLLRPPAVQIAQSFEFVYAWADRIAKIGHGRRREADVPASRTALAEAQAAPIWRGEWREVADPWLGKTISAVPDDYGKTPIVGTLTSATKHHVVIERMVPDVGRVCIHVPRIGFEITQAQ